MARWTARRSSSSRDGRRRRRWSIEHLTVETIDLPPRNREPRHKCSIHREHEHDRILHLGKVSIVREDVRQLAEKNGDAVAVGQSKMFHGLRGVTWAAPCGATKAKTFSIASVVMMNVCAYVSPTP